MEACLYDQELQATKYMMSLQLQQLLTRLCKKPKPKPKPKLKQKNAKMQQLNLNPSRKRKQKNKSNNYNIERELGARRILQKTNLVVFSR
jgi:hypothetical protein